MPYIGKTPLTGAYQLCDAIVTSATATYNLLVGGSAVIPGAAQNCIVSLNGVVQAPVSAYTVSGSTIVFASTLSATDVIDFILILGNVFDIGKPTDGSVTNASVSASAAIALSKLATTGTMTFASTIGVGGATPAASGAGITFPASVSGSSDANTLDDYEEGTWTPILSSGFSTAPTSYTEQLGRYTKIGRCVFFSFAFNPDGAVGNATTIKIGTLPFTTAAGQPATAATIAYQNSGFDSNASDSFVIEANTNTIDFYATNGGARNGNSANVDINARLIMSGWYIV